MKFRTKVGIFLIACLITFIGFSLLIPSGAIDMMKAGKSNGYKIVSNMLVVDVVKKPSSIRS